MNNGREDRLSWIGRTILPAKPSALTKSDTHPGH